MGIFYSYRMRSLFSHGRFLAGEVNSDGFGSCSRAERKETEAVSSGDDIFLSTLPERAAKGARPLTPLSTRREERIIAEKTAYRGRSSLLLQKGKVELSCERPSMRKLLIGQP